MRWFVDLAQAVFAGVLAMLVIDLGSNAPGWASLAVGLVVVNVALAESRILRAIREEAA